MRAALALALTLFLLPAAAQTQPFEPDFSGLEPRTDLTDAGDLADAQRILRFVQVSDAHIIDDDAPYPMRVGFLDPLGEPFTSAERPQEEFTDELLAAMLAAINDEHERDRLDFVVNTGDNIDNQLENELMRFLDLYEGTTTTVGPISGMTCVPDGQSESLEDDGNDETDACTHIPDFDRIALNATLPWFSAFGNHDGLIQGNVPVEPSFQELAAEFGRYFLPHEQYVDMHFQAGVRCAGGTPAGQVADDNGHGFGYAGERLCDDDLDNDGYYAFSRSGVRFIILDTVNDDFVTGNSNLAGFFNPQATLGNDLAGGYSEGAVDPAQAQWLRDELEDTDELVIVLSHHTVNSMFTKDTEGACAPQGCLGDLVRDAGYMTGAELEALLQEHDVAAWIGGHTHRHRIEAKTSDAGAFWNVESSSVIDLPQQTRVIELWQAGDKGFLALRSLDHDYEAGRALAATDEQHPDASGDAADQDVMLWFDLPMELVPQPPAPNAIQLAAEAPEGLVAPTNVSFEVSATDSITGKALAGLEVTAEVIYTPAAKTVAVAVNASVTAGSTYTITFEAPHNATYFVTVVAEDPGEKYAGIIEQFSVRVAGQRAEPGPAQDQPMPWWLVGVALAAFALRRR